MKRVNDLQYGVMGPNLGQRPPGSSSQWTPSGRKRDSNPRSLPLDFPNEGQVQGGLARTSITILPNGSRVAVECLSRIEKSQFLTDRNVTKRAWGASWTTIIH